MSEPRERPGVVEGMGRSWVKYAGLEDFAVCPLTGDEEIRVEIGAASAPTVDAGAVEDRWREMCAANARLFDGPILSVAGFRDEGFTLAVLTRRGSYKHLAVQNQVQTGTDQLSVTAVVRGLDEQGRSHILLGRRGETTRIYGGMWELGPSGGIDPPPPGVDSLDDAAVLRQVHAEIEEEMGGAGGGGGWGGGIRVDVDAAIAVTYDPVARSYDLVFHCTARGPVSATATGADNWEYRGSLWVPQDELAAFERDNAERIIGPTRALIRFLCGESSQTA